MEATIYENSKNSNFFTAANRHCYAPCVDCPLPVSLPCRCFMNVPVVTIVTVVPNMPVVTLCANFVTTLCQFVPTFREGVSNEKRP